MKINLYYLLHYLDLRRNSAIREEAEMLFKDTLIPIDRKSLPSNCKIIPTSIQLKRKRSPTTDASITRYKARICARGDLLTRFMHTLEKTSPTINELTFNFVLQLSIIYGFHRTCVDVTGAYLYQEYPFEQQSLAVILQSEVCDILGIEKDQAFMLGRYIIYGMPDAGKAYYIAFSNHIVENGYTKSY
jgi:hypothetical protein